MTEEQIRKNADAYISKAFPLNHSWEKSNEHRAFIYGAHSRDEEIEKLESLLDESIHMLRDAYAGSSFFCDRFMSIPEEVKYCMAYCDKEEAQCDCVLRYLKHYKKGE